MDTVNRLDKLLKLDVSKMTEKKGGFTYLSWANAWLEFIKIYPSAVYEIKKNDKGMPLFGDNKIGFMCYTTVTANDITHEMWMPVLDFKNKAMLNPNMFDVNKSVMRCLTKNLAMFGLGLYIYAGEDLPTESEPIDHKAIVTETTTRLVRAYLAAPQFAESVELKEMKTALNNKFLLANQYLVDELIKEYGHLNA